MSCFCSHSADSCPVLLLVCVSAYERVTDIRDKVRPVSVHYGTGLLVVKYGTITYFTGRLATLSLSSAMALFYFVLVEGRIGMLLDHAACMWSHYIHKHYVISERRLCRTTHVKGTDLQGTLARPPQCVIACISVQYLHATQQLRPYACNNPNTNRHSNGVARGLFCKVKRYYITFFSK